MATDPKYVPGLPRRVRLHRSTWVILLFAAAALFLVSFPGDKIASGVAYGLVPNLGPYEEFEHGWSWVFLRRQVNLPANRVGATTNDRIPWLQSAGWRFRADSLWLSGATDRAELGWWPWLLVLDAMVGFALLAGLAVALEWRRRRRKIWQFSLAELLLSTVLVGGVIVWWQANVRSFHAETNGVAEWAGSANVGFDYCGPRWLRRAIGVELLDSFHRLVRVSRLDVGDVNLGLLVDRHPYVERISTTFSRGDTSNKTAPDFATYIEPLSRLPNLQALELVFTTPSNEPLTPLGELRHLRVLEVHGGGAALPLRKFPSLTKLWLQRVPIGEGGLALIAQVGQLESLNLPGHSVADDDLALLAKLTNLRELNLANTRIDGSGLRHLQALTKLEALNLYGAPIDDAGAANLAGIPALRWLDLRRTHVTKAGIDQLQKLLPKCQIRLEV